MPWKKVLFSHCYTNLSFFTIQLFLNPLLACKYSLGNSVMILQLSNLMAFFLIKSLLYVLSWIFKPFLIPGYFPSTIKHTQFLLPQSKINPLFGPVSLSIFFLVFGRTLWNNSLYFCLHCIYFLTSIWSSTLLPSGFSPHHSLDTSLAKLSRNTFCHIK